MKIRYYGHIGQGSGYGQAARDLCMALLRTPGVTLEIGAGGGHLPSAYLPLASCMRNENDFDRTPDAVIVHTLPVDAPAMLERIEGSYAPGAKRVVYTTWEAADAPLAMIEQLNAFDQVWVPSAATALALWWYEDPASKRYRVVPHCFDEDTLTERRTPVRSDGPFRFYYVGAWTARKNPAALVRAFAYAFPRPGTAELVLQCAGTPASAIMACAAGTGLPAETMRWLRPQLTWTSPANLLKLHRSADCYVSASRGESWDLGMFDAVLAGRHVIAPRGLGCDEYLNGTSAHRYLTTVGIAQVDVRVLADAGVNDIQVVGAQGMTSLQRWSEPDLLDLADRMRAACATGDRELVIPYDIAERFGYRAVGALALKNLSEST